MTNKATRQLIMTALFAALIFLATSFFKIQLAPRTMVHMGNAMVVVAFLTLGTKNAMIAATVGLGIFDIVNGYLSSIQFTILEAILVVCVLSVVYRALKYKDTLSHVIVLALCAGITKIIVVFARYFITYTFTVGNDTVLSMTLTKMVNTFITSGVTVVAVPILYFALYKILEKIKGSY